MGNGRCNSKPWNPPPGIPVDNDDYPAYDTQYNATPAGSDAFLIIVVVSHDQTNETYNEANQSADDKSNHPADNSHDFSCAFLAGVSTALRRSFLCQRSAALHANDLRGIGLAAAGGTEGLTNLGIGAAAHAQRGLRGNRCAAGTAIVSQLRAGRLSHHRLCHHRLRHHRLLISKLSLRWIGGRSRSWWRGRNWWRGRSNGRHRRFRRRSGSLSKASQVGDGPPCRLIIRHFCVHREFPGIESGENLLQGQWPQHFATLSNPEVHNSNGWKSVV